MKLNSHTPESLRFPSRDIKAYHLFYIIILFLSVRLPLLSHFVSLDEAWILCSLKSIASGKQIYSEQFWRHPPLYMGLGLLLDPAGKGFEIRMELLSIMTWLISLIMFVKISSRIYGKNIALYTGIIYSLMPGAVFFDTWIKRDCLVALFGVVSYWACIKRKYWLCGLALGIAFLSKETAIFYLGASLLVIMIESNVSITKKAATTIKIFSAILILSGWWYFFMAQRNHAFLTFFTGSSDESGQFSMPWWYYFDKLTIDLGKTNFLFFIIGIISLLSILSKKFRKNSTLKTVSKIRFYPLIIILFSYTIISLSSGKPPWITISTQLFIALFAAIGWDTLIKYSNIVKWPNWIYHYNFYPYIILTIITLLPHKNFNYPQFFNTMCPGLLQPTRISIQLADAINGITKENDRVLFLPDMNRGNSAALDPIIYWNLKESLHKFYGLKPANHIELVKLIKDHHINWISFSPASNSSQEQMILKLKDEFPSLSGIRVPGFFLLNVESIRKKTNNDVF